MGKLEKDLTEFFDLLDKANGLIEGIKARHQQQEVSEAAHKGLNLTQVNKHVRNIINFTSFPLIPRPAHRPIKYPDSEEEKARFKEYREKGFSLRQIEAAEGLKKDVVAEKLKRYKLK